MIELSTPQRLISLAAGVLGMALALSACGGDPAPGSPSAYSKAVSTVNDHVGNPFGLDTRDEIQFVCEQLDRGMTSDSISEYNVDFAIEFGMSESEASEWFAYTSSVYAAAVTWVCPEYSDY